MSFPTFSTKVARHAAVEAAIVFIAYAGLWVSWALGSSWGLSGAWGADGHTDMADGFQVANMVGVTLLIIGAIVVLGRAGYWSLGLPFSVFRWGIWVFVVIATLSALANFASLSDWEQFMDAAIALLLAVLCLIVARSVVSPR